MLEHSVQAIDLDAFNKKHNFQQKTVSLETDSFKAYLAKGDLHYIWLPACPRANRVTTTLLWYGLDKQIQVHELEPDRESNANWTWKGQSIDEFFPAGVKATQPFLYDAAEQKVISNNSYEMSLMIAVAMEGSAKESLYPAAYRHLLQQWNAWIYDNVNLKIYQVAFSKDTKREAGIQKLHEIYQVLNDFLSQHDYLVNDKFSETDLRLFNNLVRHALYQLQFRVFEQPLSAYPSLYAYVERILQEFPAAKESLDIEAIRQTHFRSPHNIKLYGYWEEMPELKELFPFIIK